MVTGSTGFPTRQTVNSGQQTVDGTVHPRLSDLLRGTVNEGGTHIRLFVKNSLTVWPEN
jgi:hypothetical protein